MKAVEEPACLSVGTDVSAKYRGAFCEAKIKTVKRLVKVKVTLKSEGTSQVVHDDQVKGPLRVGSVVEVKTSEGGSSEAVISKLTDASLYTVVFDDGDEKTLRRTSLCLKGERHFAESETLDQLPLTNPEHFGTPVIGKKSNRGRRSSQAVADEENESSSSDEEEEERRVSDELLGKVCSVEGQEQGLVLVVSPGCNEELVVKKDHCLVRSFGDGKFSTVLRRNLHTLNSASSCKPELSNRKGLEEAQSFLTSGEVPEVWKMDLSQILESSSDSDEKHSEEEQENEEDLKKKNTADSEPEEEADPEERDNFLQQLYKFMEDRGTPINKPPVLGYKDLNLFKLFRLVTHHGGYSGIESGSIWKQIYMDLGIPILNSAAAYNVKTAYRKYLCGFEEYCRSALITFRTIHHNNPRPPTSPANQRPTPDLKASSPANHRVVGTEQKTSPVCPPNQRATGVELKDTVKMEADSESDSEREELLTSPRGRRRCVVPLKDEHREARKRTPRQNDQSERTPRLTEQSERGGRLTDQSERGGRLTDQSERGSEDEEDEDEDEEERLLNSAERGDSDPEADSLAGTRVRVKYGRGKTQKIYEAHIKKTDIDNGENFYLVHYFGWNVRYDEWVKADRIIWPSEKGSKKKRRGKYKNKDEADADEERPLKEERPPKGPGRRGRPLGSKNKTNGRPAERRELGNAIANGDNTPRRRTRRTSGMFDSDRASNEDSGNSSDDSESEDSMEKKQFPWRQVEPGLKEEVDRSPDQEEEEEPSEKTNEATVPSEIAAANTPQDTGPSQSQQRAEPEPVVTPERKDVAPLSDVTTSKLKLPLMVLPPRSEPMVLLHHCLPPDSDTDSASESDSEDATAEGRDVIGEEMHKQAEVKEEEEECVRSPDRNIQNTKSPLRNISLRSPIARRSPLKDRVMGVRSPPREKHVTEKRPNQSPLRPSEAEVRKSPLRPERIQEETRSKSEEIQSQRPPEVDVSTQEGALSSQQPNSPRPDPITLEPTLKQSKIHPGNSPRPERSQPEMPPKQNKIQSGNSPKIQPRNSPKPDRIQLETSPNQGKIQAGLSPRPEQNQPQNSPKLDRVQQSKVQPENSPNQLQIQVENSPKRVQSENCPNAETMEVQGSPRRGETEPVTAAAGVGVVTERSEGNTTPLKRKAPEQKTPDKKLKTDTEMSPKTTNMATAQVEELLTESKESVKDDGGVNSEKSAQGGVKAMEGGVRALEAEPVPEMGVDALVCHEVDLDEPEDREKVSASEQLMLMRESHLLRATPTPVKATPTPVKATPPQENCTERGATVARPEETTANGDRGQKRVLEGPHSPTVKKHKRPSHKRLTPHKPDKNGAGHSSDSEDQSHKHCPSPSSRGHKWTLHIDDLEKMSSAERISFLQEKLQEIRKYYLSLKSEVASIDRRRKRLKKKEREVSNTASASSSSDAALSPSSSSPSQSSLAVEVR